MMLFVPFFATNRTSLRATSQTYSRRNLYGAKQSSPALTAYYEKCFYSVFVSLYLWQGWIASLSITCNLRNFVHPLAMTLAT
jgi:hypothetical protein